MKWPTCGSTPISEFTIEGYWTQAFPTLFPTGAGDFRSPRVRSVTLADYLKHLMRYKDGRFAQHPRFRYFALNTLMRWRALETSRVFIKRNPEEAKLTVEELQEMSKTSATPDFASKVFHFGKSLHGSKQYWLMQRRNLFAMQEKLGQPSCFFTLSAADLHWPELFDLAQHYNKDSTSEELYRSYRKRNETLNANPMLADWFFTRRAFEFLKSFLVPVLGFEDYWAGIEYQHRGSAHLHGLGWIRDAPDFQTTMKRIKEYPEMNLQFNEKANWKAVERICATEGEDIVKFTDWLMSTVNPSFDDAGDGQMPKVHPSDHPCHQRWRDVDDHEADYERLIATVQRHTECKACLKDLGDGTKVCRFHFPKALQKETKFEVCPYNLIEPSVDTKRNDPRINTHNPLQLQGWRANVDMQVCVSAYGLAKYVVKYATKSEPQSKTLAQTFQMIVDGLDKRDPSRKAVSKLLMKSIGERDYSAQETCHLIMGEKLVTASREFLRCCTWKTSEKLTWVRVRRKKVRPFQQLSKNT